MDLFRLLISYVMAGAAGCAILTIFLTSVKAVFVQVIINDEI